MDITVVIMQSWGTVSEIVTKVAMRRIACTARSHGGKKSDTRRKVWNDATRMVVGPQYSGQTSDSLQNGWQGERRGPGR